MVSVALVTAATPPDDVTPEFIAGVDAPLVDALARAGARVELPAWRDQVEWAAYDLAVVRTTWDYVDHRDEFIAWAHAAAEACPVLNPPDVLRWNTHKGYLIELEERGAPVVATAWLAAGDTVELADLVASRGWGEVLAKPAVGSGSRDVLRVPVGAARQAQPAFAALLARSDLMVQPYLTSVEQQGELSVIVVDGVVTHAVRKVPVGGDFRVQQQYGSEYLREPTDTEAAELARWVVEVTGHDLLIARVDLLEDAHGMLQIVELEATEPDLYLGLAPDAAAVIAQAILRRAGGA